MRVTRTTSAKLEARRWVRDRASVADFGSAIPCLSVMQPHASLLVWGEKAIETRAWGVNHRGLVAVHASKGWGKDERALVEVEPFRSAIVRHGKRYAEELPVGALVGVVELVACKRMGKTLLEVEAWIERHAVSGEELAFGAFAEERVGWFCARPRALAEPIEMRGQVGLFALAPAIAEELKARLASARSSTTGSALVPRAGTRVVNLYDAHEVYIGRAGRGMDGYFGNYAEGIDGPKGFRAFFRSRVEVDARYRQRAIVELSGRALGCPGNCKGRDGTGRCHGDVYVEWFEELRAAASGVVDRDVKPPNAPASSAARADAVRREDFEERAGILEFQGGFSRAEAEAKAREQVR